METRLRSVLGAGLLMVGLVVPIVPAAAVAGSSEPVFISELHYDNDGTDSGEAFEVFAPACTDLTGWSVVLYNGNGGAVYGTPLLLPSPVPDLGGDAGVVHVELGTNGLQNGAPDGLALVDDSGSVRQFLSYEGTFTAVGGPADGQQSTDIGISEGGSTPVGNSLQLAGTGSTPGDLSWTSGPNTFGALGAITPDGVTPADCDDGGGGTEVPPVRINELHYDNAGTDTNEAVEVLAPAGTDLSGWSVVLYNGTNPTSATAYDTEVLSGTIADQGGGHGTVVIDYPTNGIQNGAPDGLALVEPDGSVVELLSYEGTLTAGNGPAAGMVSTDIGVAEDGSTAATQSLQRADDGSWYGPACASFGELNDADAPTTCPVAPIEVKIHEIQGTGGDSPLLGQRVIIEGVVVGDEEGPYPTFRGFFVQEEDTDADADPATSEGIFVFNFNNDDVELGDVVRVEGTVAENFGNTQLTDFVEVEVLDVDPRTATPASVTFPLDDVGDLEAYEGMAVTFEQELVISEYFNFDRFGETVVALPAVGEDRLFQPTALFAPDDPAAAQRADLNDRSQITIDDGYTNQNPDDVVHPINREPVTLANDFMGGETVTGLTGPIYYSFGLYRILPWAEGGYDTYTQLEPPATPEPVDGDLRVATLNALNYFVTLDQGPDSCGPDQDLGCRGADDATELERQRVKLLNALVGMDADVVGLIEVENTFGVEPLADIVAGLNDRLGAGTYDYVAAGDNAVVGSDAIKVGIIYRPDAVEPVGTPAVLDTPEFLDPNDLGSPKNRAAVAASFKEVATGEVFSVAVNHLKSKGSECGPGDDHPLAGNCNTTRTLAAGILADWVDSDPTGMPDDDWMILGDLNSYDKEAPIQVLQDAGFTDLLHEYEGEYAYTYLFSAELGYLDYAMSSPSLTTQVTGATAWNINSDIPDLFDYDTSFKSPTQDVLFDPATPYRASDHDAVIVGLDLASGLTASVDPLWPPNHELVEIEFDVAAGVTVTPLSATSSEADSGLGEDDVPNDIVLSDDSLLLRAERFSRDGRTYTVEVRLEDGIHVRFTTVEVVVPHDRRATRGTRPV